MKYLKSIYESIESYKWEFISDNNFLVNYEFVDLLGNKYLVEFKNDYDKVCNRKILSKQYELVYFVKDGEEYNVSKIVNVNPYRTLKTILEGILIDFLERKPWVKSIRMEGLRKESEDSEYITKRTKLYMRYLERNPVSGFTLKQIVNTIKLNKK
jgi:hypothetical protein